MSTPVFACLGHGVWLSRALAQRGDDLAQSGVVRNQKNRQSVMIRKRTHSTIFAYNLYDIWWYCLKVSKKKFQMFKSQFKLKDKNNVFLKKKKKKSTKNSLSQTWTIILSFKTSNLKLLNKISCKTYPKNFKFLKLQVDRRSAP